MAISGSQLLDRKVFKELKRRVSSIGNCGVCHKPITDVHPDDVRMIKGKPVHDDCYFQELGNEAEKHPICPLGTGRG